MSVNYFRSNYMIGEQFELPASGILDLKNAPHIMYCLIIYNRVLLRDSYRQSVILRYLQNETSIYVITSMLSPFFLDLKIILLLQF